jgi:hypothetical protein
VSQDKSVAVIAWSMGTLVTQWALKYWPSTRDVVSDFIALSADFDGTQFGAIICPSIPPVPCVPSLLQQKSDSNFITALRSGDGDSAYVPTTSIYSSADEIIQPQSGKQASAFLSDARGVGASNHQIQLVCAGEVAGGMYPNEGLLYNPLAFALVVDALTNDGPGNSSRLDLDTICAQILAPGLTALDFAATEGRPKEMEPVIPQSANHCICSHYCLGGVPLVSYSTEVFAGASNS